MKRRKRSEQKLYFDHIAIAVGDQEGRELKKYEDLFKKLGFKLEWHRDRIGNLETAMATSVMTTNGVKLALMDGKNGYEIFAKPPKPIISQVSEYYRRFGLSVQHIALRCNNLPKLVKEWSEAGVRFLTEDENHKPKILANEEDGVKVLQCFTYPLNKTLFFELKQIVKSKKALKKFEEFRDANVEGLWQSLDRAIKEGWLFKVNIFGEKEK